jgi:hypothetical protein
VLFVKKVLKKVNKQGNINHNAVNTALLGKEEIFMATYTVYKTSDGNEYSSEREAREHQDALDGKPSYKEHTYSNGDYYEGLMKLYGSNWFISGHGKMIHASGHIYEGDWVYTGSGSNKCGKGKQIYPNGNIYEGDFGCWSDGKTYGPHGKGKDTYANGSVYEGDWVDGKRHGKGKETGKVCTYEGDYANDKYNGKGKQSFPDGRVYIGDFVNSDFNGKGKLTYPDGRVEEGEWENDEFAGVSSTPSPKPTKSSSSSSSSSSRIAIGDFGMDGSSETPAAKPAPPPRPAAQQKQSSAPTAEVRFDGVYQSPLIRDSGTPSYSYLRFYEDKTVINCGTADKVKNLIKWFNKEHSAVGKGKYKISGNQISFTVRGSVNYKGSILDDGSLLLDWYSRDNENSGSYKYSFADCFSNKKGGFLSGLFGKK